jgi:hypothetical protein
MVNQDDRKKRNGVSKAPNRCSRHATNAKNEIYVEKCMVRKVAVIFLYATKQVHSIIRKKREQGTRKPKQKQHTRMPETSIPSSGTTIKVDKVPTDRATFSVKMGAVAAETLKEAYLS